uniref:Uncharacterized protein n=1 Tax=Euplotes harpa TaxID=151035 RepID=A0A7S3JAH3_9SPIT|mmetsp:Transcript_24506/g.28189  ORF Transcript_24506/g.28189 Transcript_24506/m.28189 type:complete len:110 (+) Transcript_24506:184-513(+)
MERGMEEERNIGERMREVGLEIDMKRADPAIIERSGNKSKDVKKSILKSSTELENKIPPAMNKIKEKPEVKFFQEEVDHISELIKARVIEKFPEFSKCKIYVDLNISLH